MVVCGLTKKQLMKNINIYRLTNVIILILIISIIIFTCFKVTNETNNMISKLLPKYIVIYMNGALINFAFLLSISLIPSLVLTIFKMHNVTTIILFSWLIISFFIKDSVEFYKLIYGWNN